MKIRTCQTCNDSKSIIFDAEINETVCSSCGTVLPDNVEASHELKARKYSQDNAERRSRTTLAFHDMGLSTFISKSNMDANGVPISSDQISNLRRMRHLNRISNSNRSHDRNLRNAFAILNGIKDKLSINDTLIEKSAYIYRKALDKRIIKGRSICAMMVASIYAACREANVPRTLDEIAETANTDSIFAAKCYRLLVRNLKLQMPAADSNICLTKIANRANVSQKSYRRAIEMLSILKDNPVSYGKDPNALAVATLYAACIKEGEKVSQLQIATAGNTSIVTLRKRFQDVRNLFPTISRHHKMTSKLNPPISKKCRISNQKKLLTEFEVDEPAKDQYSTISKTCNKCKSDYGACCQYHIKEMMIINSYNQLSLLLQVIEALQDNKAEIPLELLEKMFRITHKGELRTSTAKDK